jgi:hypothetical protein
VEQRGSFFLLREGNSPVQPLASVCRTFSRVRDCPIWSTHTYGWVLQWLPPAMDGNLSEGWGRHHRWESVSNIFRRDGKTALSGP